MKITRKFFQAFFTRASFAGLVLVAGASVAQAQRANAIAPEEESSILSETTIEQVFPGPVRSANLPPTSRPPPGCLR